MVFKLGVGRWELVVRSLFVKYSIDKRHCNVYLKRSSNTVYQKNKNKNY